MNALLLLASVLQVPTATVEVAAGGQIITPTQQIPYAIKFRPAPGWHLYYENPGDSGLAPSVEWDLPEGWKASPLRFPAPHMIETDGLVSFGYEEPFALVGMIEVPANLRVNGPIELKGSVRWMACMTLCKVEDAEVKLSWLFNPTAGIVEDIQPELFKSAVSSLPKKLEGGFATLAGEEYVVTIPLIGDWKRANFYSAESGVVANSTFEAKREVDSAVFSLKKSAYATETAERIRGIVVVNFGDVQESFAVDLPVGSRNNQ